MSINELKILALGTSPYWVITQSVDYSHTIFIIHKYSTQLLCLLKQCGQDSAFSRYLGKQITLEFSPCSVDLYFVAIRNENCLYTDSSSVPQDYLASRKLIV